ncbi:TPA: DUF3169 family protein [Streptococcus equi subsp. zooepidemicus]|uniref:DUF3169 family protein n=1 Tax=Streptococcus equi TaxID=1336 RepID=UPI001E2ECF03|nr:DUF3169 family protein [Streptococcus equi]MCD3375707.1 DUF3169 family protein [Streptococcus equi subsp. zooepidemicus]MCD3422774.1 DUF3169 family protein [Streptococcus equi subsp. zooepidemicus]MCD3443972.1 DUF3169 family protein [Streptococcus equi subsp. zooepidemicus]HEL0025077.1 DUF3169 family protein [Streptococcus equi subsp. zooepidemicus]HEL0380773.1 DUF3169 family protein [Streptococcus equi subsp. zooepidemicus]
MKAFMTEKDSTLVRILKSLLLGSGIGLVLGGLVGFGLARFNILENGFPISEEDIITGIKWAMRPLVIVLMLLSIYDIYQVVKEYARYVKLSDDETEELYRYINLKHAYALGFSAMAMVLNIVVFSLGYRVPIANNASYLGLTFPIYEALMLVVISVLHAYILKVYTRIRGVKMTLAPTLKELKQNILQQDEAELQANYQMSFEVVMGLSGFILPGIYVILLLLSMIFQRVELTGLIITASIHLYILVKSFKSAHDFYR